MHRYFNFEEFGLLADCVHSRITSATPFGIVRLPDRDDFNKSLLAVWAEGTDIGQYDLCIRVKPWLSHRWLNLTSAEATDIPPMPVCPVSTPMAAYLETVAWLVRRLRQRGGKTVICRNICGRFGANPGVFGICDIIRRYFEAVASATTLTFVFWHPRTGFWMGSTPELIMEHNHGGFSTMALAGTMPAEGTEPWSQKNIVEHEIVADYMQRRLGRSGIAFRRSPRGELTAGAVKHLCTRFNSGPQWPVNRDDSDALVETIEPTPALAGYPRREAIDEIHTLELWHRYFYAGLINLADDCNNLTYGLIRCVHFDFERWSIYTGSGITPDSDPMQEWKETEAKARPLTDLLTSFSSSL